MWVAAIVVILNWIVDAVIPLAVIPDHVKTPQRPCGGPGIPVSWITLAAVFRKHKVPYMLVSRRRMPGAAAGPGS